MFCGFRRPFWTKWPTSEKTGSGKCQLSLCTNPLKGPQGWHHLTLHKQVIVKPSKVHLFIFPVSFSAAGSLDMSLSTWSLCLRRNSNKVSRSSSTSSQVSVRDKLLLQQLRQQAPRVFFSLTKLKIWRNCWLCFSGNPAIMPKRIFRTRWFNNPWTCGSYSNPAVGWSLQDLSNLREPLPSKESQSQVHAFVELLREHKPFFFIDE